MPPFLQGFPNWGSMSGILFQLLAQIEQNSKIPTASLSASTAAAADKGKHNALHCNVNPPSSYICNLEFQDYIYLCSLLPLQFNCGFFASNQFCLTVNFSPGFLLSRIKTTFLPRNVWSIILEAELVRSKTLQMLQIKIRENSLFWFQAAEEERSSW